MKDTNPELIEPFEIPACLLNLLENSKQSLSRLMKLCASNGYSSEHILDVFTKMDDFDFSGRPRFSLWVISAPHAKEDPKTVTLLDDVADLLFIHNHQKVPFSLSNSFVEFLEGQKSCLEKPI